MTKNKVRSDAVQIVAAVLAVILVLSFMYREAPKQEPKSNMVSGLITLTPTPFPSSVTLGTQVRIDLISTQSINLAGVQLTVTFNQTILSFINVTEGAFLKSGGASTIFLNTLNTSVPGQLRDISIVRIGSGVNGSGTVASIYFNTIGLGTSRINITRITLSDNNGNPISNPITVVANVTVTNPADVTPPSQVTGLVAVQVSTSQINLAWNPATDNVGVASYRVYRDGVNVANTTLTTYSSTGLSAGTWYNYNVAAVDAAGNVGTQSIQESAITRLRGDVNNDGIVGLQDLQLVVQDFSKTSGFNPAVDLAAPFGTIDLFDAMAVVLDWGRTG